MKKSNRELILEGLDLLQKGLQPFIEKEMRKRYGESWERESRKALKLPDHEGLHWDAQTILKLMDIMWKDVFGTKLKKKHRSWVNEALALRNDFAHQQPFTDDDASRGLDTIKHLLTAVSPPQSQEANLLKKAIDERRSAGNDTLPIDIVPSNPDIFKQQLLRSRVAEIVIIYSDGRKEIKIWNAAKFSASSNVIGNLRSRSEFRSGQWQANGIVKVAVKVIDNV